MFDSNVAVMKIEETGDMTLAHDIKDFWRLEQMKCLQYPNCNIAVAECAYRVKIRRWTLAESVHMRYADFAKRYLGQKP